jgi:Cu2+-exporting ATPase
MLATASAFVKRGILIKRLQAIEAIARIDSVIFDKTGTLTEDHIEIKAISHKAGLTEASALALAAAIARHSQHPVSRALLNAYQAVNAYKLDEVIVLEDIAEEVGAGINARLKNQPGITAASGIADLNLSMISGRLKLGSAKFCGVDASGQQIQQVFLADEQGWLATFDLQEAIKAEVAQTIQRLQAMQLQVELLSGDQLHTVQSLCRAVGISAFAAACSPHDKLLRLHALKQQGKKVLMVGDGLNDGPVLASAHVSIAMGKGVPLTLAHADYILLNGDISQIPALIRHAQQTMRVIKQNIAWALVYNLISIPLAFTGVLSPWLAGLGMAVSSLIVVANALRLTNFVANPAASMQVAKET